MTHLSWFRRCAAECRGETRCRQARFPVGAGCQNPDRSGPGGGQRQHPRHPPRHLRAITPAEPTLTPSTGNRRSPQRLGRDSICPQELASSECLFPSNCSISADSFISPFGKRSTQQHLYIHYMIFIAIPLFCSHKIRYPYNIRNESNWYKCIFYTVKPSQLTVYQSFIS